MAYETIDPASETEMDRAMKADVPTWQAVDDIQQRESSLIRSGGFADYEELQSGVDALKGGDRELYERTRYKVMISLIYGALCLMFLGFCAECGGKSSAFNYMLQKSNAKSLQWQEITMGGKSYAYLDSACLNLLVGGIGFGAFCHFAAFSIALAAACLMSPYFTGTVREMSILKGPVDFNKEVKRRRSRAESSGFKKIGL